MEDDADCVTHPDANAVDAVAEMDAVRALSFPG
jgi:hypothetical protein